MKDTGHPRSSQRQDHPDEQKLLLLLDGELSSQEKSEIEEHLHRCWECRTKAQKLQNGIYAFVEYAETSFSPKVGAPPNGWRGFDALLDHATIGAAPPRTSLRTFAALLQSLAGSRQRRWSFAAAAAGLLAFIVMWPVAAPPALSASEFLGRVQSSRRELAGRAQGKAILQRVRIRVGAHSLVRNLVHSQSVVSTATHAKPEEPEVQSAFEQARLDWSDPLNPDRYSAWHASLAAATDRVTKAAGSVTLTTNTNETAIREASLTVDANDWHPTTEQFRLESGTTIEIAELSFSIGAVQPQPEKFSKNPEPAPSEHELRSATISAPEFLAAEVEVRVALHELGLDLGEPLEIQRSTDGGVIVSGTVSNPEKLLAARKRMAQIPNVTQDFQAASATPAGFRAADVTAGQLTASGAATPVLFEKLKSAFPDLSARTAFVNGVAGASDDQLVRILAVKRLAERYTPAVEAQLDEVSKQKLQGILDDHISALRRQSASLASRLGPFLNMPAERPQQRAAVSGWQEQAATAFRSIETIDQLCTELLIGVPHSGADAAQSERLLNESLATLRSTLELPYRLD